MSNKKLQNKTYRLPLTLPEKQSVGYLFNVLDKKDSEIIHNLKDELIDTYEKAHMYRSDTEARISILNDISYPTPAAKYWQCVREQNTHFEEAVNESYRIKHIKIDILKAEKQIKEAIEEKDEIKRLEGELERDGKTMEIGNLTRSLKWRIYELQMWSNIKKELDDGSFDTNHVDSHMAESYQIYWGERVKALHKDSNPGEIINALGSFISAKKVTDEENNIIPFNKIDSLATPLPPPKITLLKDLSKELNEKTKLSQEQFFPTPEESPEVVVNTLKSLQNNKPKHKEIPTKNNSWY